MHMAHRTTGNLDGELLEIADLAESLGGSAHAEAVRDVAALLQDTRLRGVVFGEFSVGKSTLINALLGRTALPAKARPTTGHATHIRFGRPEGVRVTLADGRTEPCPLDQLASFVTLDLQSRAREDVEAIEVVLEAPLLRDGLTLIDTPGLTDTEVQTRRAERAVMGSDLVLLVLRAEQMLGAETRHRAAVWMARELGKPVVPVLNGLNLVEDKDRRELRRLLGAWVKATLTPPLGKPFYEVNAIGALRHALGIDGAGRPADDFFALREALEGLAGRARQELQAASRANQARAVLRRAADWNRGELEQLSEAAAALQRRRRKQGDRLRLARDGLTRRLDAEVAHARTLVGDELRRGWERLAKRLAGKGKDDLEKKWQRWLDTYLDEAVRAAEKRANERLAALGTEVDEPAPEPLTVAQLVALTERAKVDLTPPDNSAAVTKGAVGGALAGTAIGSAVPILGTVTGAVLGYFVGGLLADRLSQQEPDYAAAYTKAARTDWDRAAAAVEEAAAGQFKARLNELVKRLTRQLTDLERTPAADEELRLRRKLAALLERALGRLGR